MKTLIISLFLLIPFLSNGQSASHDFMVYYNQGFQELEAGFNHDAITDFDNAIAINPNIWAAYYNRGNAKYNIRDFKGAINDYNETMQLKVWTLVKVLIFYKRGLSKIAIGDKKGGCLDLDISLRLGNPSAKDAIEECKCK